MKKSVFVIIFTIITFISSILIGLNVFKIIDKNKKKDVDIGELYGKEISNVSRNIVEIEDKILSANAGDEKITPNTKLVLRKYYEECGHSINEYVEMPVELVNLTKEELEVEYKNWKVYSFSEEQVILIKNVQDYCDQHYILRELNGYVAIYKVNNNGKEQLIEKTSIAVRYLTETDLSHLKNGMKVYGIENLNKTLEDFE